MAMKLLEEMADIGLISIQKKSENRFSNLLEKLRANGDALSLEEITAEVEIVRTERYTKRGVK